MTPPHDAERPRLPHARLAMEGECSEEEKRGQRNCQPVVGDPRDGGVEHLRTGDEEEHEGLPGGGESEFGGKPESEPELQRAACPLDAPKTGLRVEGYTPPGELIRSVETIMQAAQIEVGGVEYITDDRDGRIYFYDINALSNFVADPLRVVGLDPTARLVDALEARASGRRP